jgi:hypothetical protein
MLYINKRVIVRTITIRISFSQAGGVKVGVYVEDMFKKYKNSTNITQSYIL